MIQFIRGNTAANDSYTGPNSSLSVDTEAKNIRLHDGVTPGGTVIANINQAGVVQSVSGSSPIVISGTLENPVIEIRPATPSQDGYMSQADKANLDEAYGWGDHSAAGYESTSNKGTPNGYAGLDGSGKVPSAQLPSFVDDVLEYSTLSNFPTTGEAGKIYVALDTNRVYRWGGSSYTEISPGEVSAVNGKTGNVTLTTTDISEGANLYFTEARARAAISVSGDLDYTNGVISFNETYSTAAEIKTAYESNANTNAYTDAEKSKLAGIEAGAEANAVDSVNGQTGAVTIPNADENTAGLISAGTQTIGGDKTFTGVITIDEGAI